MSTKPKSWVGPQGVVNTQSPFAGIHTLHGSEWYLELRAAQSRVTALPEERVGAPFLDENHGNMKHHETS